MELNTAERLRHRSCDQKVPSSIPRSSVNFHRLYVFNVVCAAAAVFFSVNGGSDPKRWLRWLGLSNPNLRLGLNAPLDWQYA